MPCSEATRVSCRAPASCASSAPHDAPNSCRLVFACGAKHVETRIDESIRYINEPANHACDVPQYSCSYVPPEFRKELVQGSGTTDPSGEMQTWTFAMQRSLRYESMQHVDGCVLMGLDHHGASEQVAAHSWLTMFVLTGDAAVITERRTKSRHEPPSSLLTIDRSIRLQVPPKGHRVSAVLHSVCNMHQPGRNFSPLRGRVPPARHPPGRRMRRRSARR